MSSINFDSCSLAWRANKKRAGEQYTYICSSPLCKRSVCKDAYGMVSSLFCSRHREQTTKEETFARVNSLVHQIRESASASATGASKDDASIADRVLLRRRG